MKAILTYVDVIERAKFYLRIENCEFTYITDNITVYIYLKLKKTNVYFIKRNSENTSKEILESDITNTIEVKLNNISKNEAKVLYFSIYRKINDIFKSVKFDYIFLWNGCKIGDIACADFAKLKKIPLRYLEIANIPGKLFVDNKGTNKNSSIYTNPEQLDFEDKENLKKFELWREAYLKNKRSNYILPQSKRAVKLKRLISPILNIIIIKLGIGIKNKVYYRNLKKFFSTKHKIIDNTNIDFEKEKYVFVPLQVSDDTQIMLNSNIDLKGLIDYSYKYSVENNLKLVLKPHPADEKSCILDYIVSLNDKNIIITNYNTMKLIENSELVITINSTVGLEAIIAKKAVKFLGYSFYDKLTERRLINYVMTYLKNVDYFSNKPFDVTLVLQEVIDEKNSHFNR